MTRVLRSPVSVAFAASAVLLLAFAAILSDASSPPARAAATGGMDAMSVDMDPSAAPANTNSSVGSIEQCARMNENDTLDADEDAVDVIHVDVTAEGIPYGDNGTAATFDDTGGIIGFQYDLTYPVTSLTVVEHSLKAGSAAYPVTSIIGVNSGSSISDISEYVPDDDANNFWQGAALDNVYGPPEEGGGVLQRLALASDPGATAGQHVVGLIENAHFDVTGDTHIPLTTGFGNVAIGQPCGALETPGPTPVLTSIPTSPPGSTPVATTPGATPPSGDYRMEAMSVDVDPSADPANTNSTVGSIEQCARINENDTLDADEDAVDVIHVDVTAEGIPAANDNGTPNDPADDTGGILAFQYVLAYPSGNLTVVGHSLRPGSSFSPVASILAVNAGSSVLDVSDPVPDDDFYPGWLGTALDTGVTVPEGGSGVLQRVALASFPSATNGQFVLSLTANVHLDWEGNAYLPKTTRIANVAIGQPCGLLVTPSPSPSPSPTPMPTPTPVPTPIQTPRPPTPTPCCPPPVTPCAACTATPTSTPCAACTPAPTPVPCSPPCPQDPIPLPQAPAPTPTPGSAPSEPDGGVGVATTTTTPGPASTAATATPTPTSAVSPSSSPTPAVLGAVSLPNAGGSGGGASSGTALGMGLVLAAFLGVAATRRLNQRASQASRK